VTYYLYDGREGNSVTSGEILSMVKAALEGTGHEDAAAALSDYHHQRRLRRSRVEVVSNDFNCLSAAEKPASGTYYSVRWNKSRIVADLVSKYKISSQTARAVAGMVEEKILNMGVSSVSAGLVKELVLGDAATIIDAEKQLQAV